MTGRRRVRIPNPPEGGIPLPHGDSQAASTFDELLVYLRHSAKQSGFSIIEPAQEHRRLTPSPKISRLLLCGNKSGKLVNGRTLTSCTWRAQAFRSDIENGWIWQLIYDIHNHEAMEPESNDKEFPSHHDIGKKASTPMTDQAHVALLEANLRFDELDNFDYWFSREHPETEEYLNIRNIRPAYIRSSLGPLPKRGPEHIKKCKGRCKHCQDADVPCLKNGNRVKRCERCIKNGLECSDFSHTPTLPAKTAVKVPCERCGHFMWPWNLKNHLPQCKGKCSECMKGNAPCLFRLGKRCERCAKRKLECGSFSHEHLAENKYICSRCDNAYGSAFTLSQHVARCRGKCDQCKDSNIPCVWIGTSSACTSCVDKEIQCTGIETAGAPSATDVPCPHCLSLIPQKSIAVHEKRCRGRCDHCIELDVPCEHSQGGAHVCSQCRQDEVECVFK